MCINGPTACTRPSNTLKVRLGRHQNANRTQSLSPFAKANRFPGTPSNDPLPEWSVLSSAVYTHEARIATFESQKLVESGTSRLRNLFRHVLAATSSFWRRPCSTASVAAEGRRQESEPQSSRQLVAAVPICNQKFLPISLILMPRGRYAEQVPR